MPKRKRAGSNNLADQTCPTRSKTQARVPNVPASAEEKDKCIQELMDDLKHVKDDLKRSEAFIRAVDAFAHNRLDADCGLHAD